MCSRRLAARSRELQLSVSCEGTVVVSVVVGGWVGVTGAGVGDACQRAACRSEQGS
jgi:hypothetical protein